VLEHMRTLVDKLGATWVEPLHEEKKAKLADVDAIVEAVLHRLANGPKPGPLAGKKALVVSGSTAESIDPVRVITNRSSGRSGLVIATELQRLGAEVTLWQGHATVGVPAHLARRVVRFDGHADLMAAVQAADLSGYDQVWMPAAIGDYAPRPAKAKIASGKRSLSLELTPLPKVVETIRKAAPKAVLVAFKAESDAKALLSQAKDRLKRYGAQFVVANTSDAFGSDHTDLLLVHAKGQERLHGPKSEVLPTVVGLVALAAAKPRQPTKASKPATRKGTSKK
jgi:phosphopantothenoylcysteine decarboxylase / phosphopantothenate---cysteine ligase